MHSSTSCQQRISQNSAILVTPQRPSPIRLCCHWYQRNSSFTHEFHEDALCPCYVKQIMVPLGYVCRLDAILCRNLQTLSEGARHVPRMSPTRSGATKGGIFYKCFSKQSLTIFQVGLGGLTKHLHFKDNNFRQHIAFLRAKSNPSSSVRFSGRAATKPSIAILLSLAQFEGMRRLPRRITLPTVLANTTETASGHTCLTLRAGHSKEKEKHEPSSCLFVLTGRCCSCQPSGLAVTSALIFFSRAIP